MGRFASLIVALVLACPAVATSAEEKLDPVLAARAGGPGTSRVILTTTHGGPATEAIRVHGGSAGRLLPAAGSQVAIVPDLALPALAARMDIAAIRADRPVAGTLDTVLKSVGGQWVREQLGYDGTGIGVAIVDSGVTNWHDDLGSATVVHFVDFVTNLVASHDDYGHGTHVAGTIAGSGYDSSGLRRGIAPGAHLVVLKVLDETGNGHISSVIAAIDYAVEHREQFNIRVINLSVASGVYESYRTDPLTVAARRAVEAGIVVVTAAGNLGRSGRGTPQHGGITSPGNAPWVITVGATDHRNTANRADDVVAPFSSRGLTHIDRALKPDLVAPGVGIESLSAPGSSLYARHPEARIDGSVDTVHPPYIALTGTSMAAPLVTGTVALMLEANPALTPNLVKAILHYTAERKPRAESVAQGAGLLNSRGAVQLAVSLAGGDAGPSDPTRWGRHVLWGNSRVRGGMLSADANAWRHDVTWGDWTTPDGEDIVWGVAADGGVWAASGYGGDLQSDLPIDQISWAETPSRSLAWAATAVRYLPAPEEHALPPPLPSWFHWRVR